MEMEKIEENVICDMSEEICCDLKGKDKKKRKNVSENKKKKN